MARIDYFMTKLQTLKSFVHKVNLHKKLGLFYDSKHQNNTLSKEEQKSYLIQLRDLERQLKEINCMARSALENIIKNDQDTTFHQLKNTDISVLYFDKNSTVSIKYMKRYFSKEGSA